MRPWLDAARAAADREPERPRQPLAIATRADRSDRDEVSLVGSVEPAIAARARAAGLPLSFGDDGRWTLAGPADATLAAFAAWLHREGLCGRWRDELLAVEDASGVRVGAVERETAEEAGLAIEALQSLRARGRITVRRPVAEGYMVEHIEVYTATVPDGLVPVNRDGEVERFDCLASAALERRLAAGEFTLEATLILGGLLEARFAPGT